MKWCLFRVPADQRKTRKLTATKIFVNERWFNNTFSSEGDIAIIKLPTKMRGKDILMPCTDFEGNFSSFHKIQGLVILNTIKSNLIFKRFCRSHSLYMWTQKTLSKKWKLQIEMQQKAFLLFFRDWFLIFFSFFLSFVSKCWLFLSSKMKKCTWYLSHKIRPTMQNFYQIWQTICIYQYTNELENLFVLFFFQILFFIDMYCKVAENCFR